jgi:hypothetical protein
MQFMMEIRKSFNITGCDFEEKETTFNEDDHPSEPLSWDPPGIND